MTFTRTYTDDDLVTAVARSHSWRGVLRSLGLKATSASAARSVRRSAEALDIDFSHFTGQRRWTEAQLADAVESSRSWVEVATKLGLSPHSGHSLGAHAARLRINADHLKVSAARDFPPPHELAVDMAHLRRAGALLAASWLTLCGCDVSWPLEPCRYDLLVGLNGQFARVQVKTTTFQAGTGWVVRLSTTGRRRLTYGVDEIDYFFVIDGDMNYYLIPFEAVGGLQGISLAAYSAYQVSAPEMNPSVV